MSRRTRLMGRLVAAGASDPWVLLVGALGGGTAWAVGIPVAVSAGIGVGMVGVGAVGVALTGEPPSPEPSGDPRLRAGTEQAELVDALDGYLDDLTELRESRRLPPAVVDPAIEALTAAKDSRGVAVNVASAIDALEDALVRSERVHSRWSGSVSSAEIAASVTRMRARRGALLASLSQTVGQTAEVYTKLLEVSTSIDSAGISEAGVTDLEAVSSSLDSLRSAVAALENEEKRAALGELEGPPER